VCDLSTKEECPKAGGLDDDCFNFRVE